MKINNNKPIGQSDFSYKANKTKTGSESAREYSESGLNNMAVYNKANISFKGYYGDQQPAKKLFWILTGRNNICKDDETANHTYCTYGGKKWSTINPEDLLKRTPEQAIQSICTLNDNYEIPSYILSPNYGDKWGRRANYIEINPRMVAMTNNIIL